MLDLNDGTDTLPMAGSDFMNPIAANLFNVPAFFSGDTPIRAAQAALRAYAQGLQSPPPWRAGMPIPEGCEVITFRGRQVLRCRGREQAPVVIGEESQQPDLRDQYPGIPLPPRGGTPGIPEGAPGAPPSTDTSGGCSPWDLECVFKKIVGSDAAKDIGKRITLLAFALVLLVVAIISLR